MSDHVDIVFDGPPSPLSCYFIDVENAAGHSITFGEWIKRDDGYWVLRFSPADFPKPNPPAVGDVELGLLRELEKHIKNDDAVGEAVTKTALAVVRRLWPEQAASGSPVPSIKRQDNG
jgi:hypothetical protein